MTREEAVNIMSQMIKDEEGFLSDNTVEAHKMAIKALEQEPCEMTAEEYRQKMIQAFHNANTDELIALCVPPTEKEFENLEWLLKNHYKQKTKTGHWIFVDKAHEHAHCSECDYGNVDLLDGRPHNYCPNCGFRMIEPQESQVNNG